MSERELEYTPETTEEERAVEIHELQAATSRLLKAAGSEKWRPRELQARARNGERTELVSLAFWQLVNDGRLVLDRDLKVRRARRS